MKSFILNNVEFSSVEEAAKFFGTDKRIVEMILKKTNEYINKSKEVLLVLDGKGFKDLADIAEYYKIDINYLRDYLNKGLSLNKAVSLLYNNESYTNLNVSVLGRDPITGFYICKLNDSIAHLNNEELAILKNMVG